VVTALVSNFEPEASKSRVLSHAAPLSAAGAIQVLDSQAINAREPTASDFIGGCSYLDDGEEGDTLPATAADGGEAWPQLSHATTR